MRASKRVIGWTLAGLLAAAAMAGPPAAAPPRSAMKQYQTRYYVIHSDLPIDDVREGAVRMTAMAEEYYERTKGFTGVIRQRMPFYLFADEADYRAAGGIEGSAGIYTGRKLMALADPQTRGYVWETIQHEGFHQFADAVIGGEIPVWVNEGLAEYFAAALFTGDTFISGVIPAAEADRVKAMIRANQCKPFEAIMQLDHDQWNRQVGQGNLNYLQAWSMVHFLAHAEGGKYQKAFESFLKAVGRNRDWKNAWKQRFGTDIAAFQKRWARWWLDQPADPTPGLYDKAVVATMTSYLARATSQGQRFETPEQFFEQAQAGKLKAAPLDWLPPKLLADNLPKARKLGRWSLSAEPAKPPQLQCQTADGTVYVGRFTLKAGRVDKVTVQVQAPTSQPDEPGLGLAAPRGGPR